MARSRDADGGNHGFVLSWQDMDKVKHELVVTLDMLTGDGVELRKLLMNGGLRGINAAGGQGKVVGLSAGSQTGEVAARSVFAIGWQPGGVTYVSLQQTFGGITT
ncbi:MAG: DUF927 domain-containing protein [Thiothrix sp.]